MLSPECRDSWEVEGADAGLTQAEGPFGHQVHGHWMSNVTKKFDNNQKYHITMCWHSGSGYLSVCPLVPLSINTACHLEFIS